MSRAPIVVDVKLTTYAMTAAFRGLRTGDVPLFVLGSATAIVIWRRGRSGKKVTAHKLKLSAGEAVALRVTGKRAAPKEFIFRG